MGRARNAMPAKQGQLIMKCCQKKKKSVHPAAPASGSDTEQRAQNTNKQNAHSYTDTTHQSNHNTLLE